MLSFKTEYCYFAVKKKYSGVDLEYDFKFFTDNLHLPI
jgi:hypothetical protein